MIRINLMPKAEARRQAARQRDAQVTTLILAGLAGTILLAEFFTRRTASDIQHQADTHREELADLDRKHKEAAALQRKKDELQSKLSTITALERQKTGPVKVLDQLSIATPEKLWLTEVAEVGGTMTLIGKGLDNQTIATFMRNLSLSAYFDGVDLVETKQIEEGPAKLKQFSVKARVLYGGRPAPQGGAGATSAANTGTAKPGQAMAGGTAAGAAQPGSPPPQAPAAPAQGANGGTEARATGQAAAGAGVPSAPSPAVAQPAAAPPAAPLSATNPLAGTIEAKRAAEAGVRQAESQAKEKTRQQNQVVRGQ